MVLLADHHGVLRRKCQQSKLEQINKLVGVNIYHVAAVQRHL